MILSREKPFQNEFNEYQKELYYLGCAIKENFNEIKRDLLANSKIIFSTLNSAGKSIMQNLKGKISYLIIDEAT